MILISTGWNIPQELYDRCIDSIRGQGTGINLESCINIDLTGAGPRKGKLANFVDAVISSHPQPEDIICDLDLDDYLLPGALQTVLDTYRDNPDILLTYGSYRNESGKPARFNGEYKTDNFRELPWRATHIKTFKYKLYRQVKIRDLHGPDGKYFMTTSDLALMFPMMDMAGLDRIKHIKECLYCYNDMNPASDHRMWGDMQKRNEKYIRALPRRSRIETI
jgi:hypothetical protein